MSAEVIYIPNQDGVRKPYKLFSARLPDFLDKYPLKDGYKVLVENEDYMNAQPTLVELYKMAIQAGRNPLECGLPALPDSNCYVFTARLFGPHDDLLGSASAVKVIHHAKDWEIGETAARQRLIASLGFGGDCFDKDEMEDLASRNIFPETASGAEEEADKVKSATTAQEAPEQRQSDSQEPAKETQTLPPKEVVQQVVSKPARVVASKPKTETEIPPVASNAENAEVIPVRIIRQLEHQAKLRNVEVPKVTTVKEAKAALKELMKA